MGKRKYNNPNDSSDESEIEWVESKSSKVVKTEIKTNSSIAPESDLIGSLLNGCSSKSLSEIRSEKNKNREDAENKLYEDRLYKSKSSDSSNTKNYDVNWLKKSYLRCLEQAKVQCVDVTELLHIRYDDDTINFMLNKFGKNCGGSQKRKNYFDSSYKSELNSNNKKIVSHNYEDTYDRKPTIINNNNSKNSTVEQRYVNNDDINEASASLMRAQLTRNDEKIKKAMKRLDTLKEAQERGLKVKLTRTKYSNVEDDKLNSESETVMKCVKSGKMVPYLEHGSRFQNSSKVGEMRNMEKYYDADDMDNDFVRLSSSTGPKMLNEDDCEREYGNDFVKKQKDDKKEHLNAIKQHKQVKKLISDCKYCNGKIARHLVITKGEYMSLVIPIEGSLNPLHCQIIPLDHVASVARIDNEEDILAELDKFRKKIVEFHKKESNSKTVFMEAVGKLNKYPHCRIDCVPLPKGSISSSAPMKFRKAIQDAKGDSSVNKGLLKLRKGGIRRTVPAEMRYFCVEFGYGHEEDGMAFVVEKDHAFSDDFGLNIAADLLGLDSIQMRQIRKSGWEEQADIVLNFEKKWKKYGVDLAAPNDDSD